MANWYQDGDLSGFIAVSASTPDPAAYRYKLASNGSTDLGGITRLQYEYADTAATPNRIRARAPISFGAADARQAAGKRMGATMFVAPASLFSSKPSADLIRQRATIVVRGDQSISVPSSGNVALPSPGLNITINGPRPSVLQAATKYWVCVVPTFWVNNSTPSVTNDKPLDNGFPRALSVWTNRSPGAATITSPSASSLIASGSTLRLNFTPDDPDYTGPGTNYEVHDLAGAQVQYSPKPTPENPTPDWIDVPVYQGGMARAGWYLAGMTGNGGVDSPAKTLQTDLGLSIKAGGSLPSDGAYLSSGVWRLRVRTFDFGHPYPRTIKPLGREAGDYTAQTYPATNTGAWSEPVTVTITAQVPAPVPIRPVRDAAAAVGSPVSLLWAYRNTHLPPLPQKTRTVRIRRLNSGDPWTVLVNAEQFGSAQLDLGVAGEPGLAGFTLVSGNRYEWQVMVTDSENVASDWSPSAQFWVVAEPASGESTVLPTDTIEGALLGHGNNRAFIYRRGGQRLVGEITGKIQVEWNRNRDDISVAVVRVRDWDDQTGAMLADIEPWAHELVIVREDGYESPRVWEGPITLPTFEVDQVTIQAKDVLNYTYRRALRQELNDSLDGDSIIARAVKIIQNAFAPDDPNVLPYLTIFTRDDDGKQYRNTPAYSRYAWEELDDMAANSGLDYVAVGRSIIVWGTRNRIGTLPEFRDEHFGSPPVVSVYGMSMANRYIISDGNGVWGAADRLNSDGVDPKYGLVEMLSSSWAADAAEDTGTYTEEGMAKVEQAFEDHAESSIGRRYPAPLVVRVPDGTSVSPDAPININQLIPGVAIPLRSDATLRSVFGMQKLDSVKVVQTEAGEVITVTMSSFSKSDDETSEAGEDEGEIA